MRSGLGAGFYSQLWHVCFSNLLTPALIVYGGVLQMQKLRALLLGPRAVKKVPSVVGQNIALHAVPAHRFSYLPSFCLPGSCNFVSSKFLQSAMVECVLSSESEFVLVVGIHFVSP